MRLPVIQIQHPIKHQRHDHFELLTEDMISFESDIGMPDLTNGWAKLTDEYLVLLACVDAGSTSPFQATAKIRTMHIRSIHLQACNRMQEQFLDKR